MYLPSVYYFCSYPPKTKCTLSSPLYLHYLDQVFLLVEIFSVLIAVSHLLGVCFRSTFLVISGPRWSFKAAHSCSAGSLTGHNRTVQLLTRGLDLHSVHCFLFGSWTAWKIVAFYEVSESSLNMTSFLFGSSPNRRRFWSLFTKVILKELESPQWCSASHP